MPRDSSQGTMPPSPKDLTQPTKPLSTTPCYFRVDRRDISLLRFILEAYEGVATLTTVDAQAGIVKVLMAPGCERLVTDLLAALCQSREILMEPLPATSSDFSGDS
jgi:hypothetical protein